MRDVLSTLEGWVRDGRRVVVCTVVRTERSAPRLPGSVMAVSDTGEVAGSVTGGCVESALYAQTEEVMAGGPPRLAWGPDPAPGSASPRWCRAPGG